MNGAREFICSKCNTKWSEDSGFHDPYACPTCKSDQINRAQDDTGHHHSNSFLSRQRGRFSE